MKQTKKSVPMKQCIIAVGILINVVGAFLAIQVRLPLYMDSIGTILISALLGPVYGGLTGLLGGVVSGMTFDVYSFYFSPAQMLTGIMAGLFFRSIWLKGVRMPFGVLVMSLPCTILSSIIAAFVFGGVTSAGSSVIVLLLDKLGVPMTASVFVTQVVTEYFDKMLAVIVAGLVIRAMTYEMKAKIRGER